MYGVLAEVYKTEWRSTGRMKSLAMILFILTISSLFGVIVVNDLYIPFLNPRLLLLFMEG